MKKSALLIFLGTGWILFILFLISGTMYSKFSPTSSSTLAGISWDNHMDMFKGVIQCSLGSDELEERKSFVKENLFSKVIKKEKSTTSMTYYFDDKSETLDYAMEFLQKEKDCCPFFKFDMSILPFSKGFAVKISGTEDAMHFLQEIDDSI